MFTVAYYSFGFQEKVDVYYDRDGFYVPTSRVQQDPYRRTFMGECKHPGGESGSYTHYSIRRNKDSIEFELRDAFIAINQITEEGGLEFEKMNSKIEAAKKDLWEILKGPEEKIEAIRAEIENMGDDLNALISSLPRLVGRSVSREDVYELEDREDGKDYQFDPRSGDFYMGDGFVVPLSEGDASYYGGLEYVDEESVEEVGDYKFYKEDNSYVKRIVNVYEALVEPVEDAKLKKSKDIAP